MIDHEPQDTSPLDRPKAHIKGRFWSGLEKMVEIGKDIGKTIKQNTKKALIVFSLPFLINNSVSGGYLSTRCNSSFTKPYMGISHRMGEREPEEGYYGKDIRFNGNANPPTIDIYSKINFDPYRLMKDYRPLTSMTTVNTEISGRLSTLPEPQDAQLQFTFYDTEEDNFSKKNIIGELYQRVDDGEGGYKYALIGDYDIKNVVNSARTIPISINNGITQGDAFFPSHKLNYHFFHYADLNRDREIDKQDFAIFSQNWGRTGIIKGSNPNDANDYADIADVYDADGVMVSYGDGTVDNNDLDIFKTYFKFPGDISLDGKVGLDDYAYFAADWNATDVNSVADISGPNGIPDNKVDFYDLGAFVDDYLKDSDSPNTW